MPFKYRIWFKGAVYCWRILNSKKDPILKECVKELRDQGADDPGMKLILETEGEIGTPIEVLKLKELKEKVIERAVIFVLDEKMDHVSLRSQPQPSEWFRLQNHVNDSRCSMVLNMARSGNLLLGNRMQNKFGKQWKMCPGCRKIGQDVKLDEGHMILRCPLVSSTRHSTGVEEFINHHQGQSTSIILRKYLGQDRAGMVELRNRAVHIHQLVGQWLIRTRNFPE